MRHKNKLNPIQGPIGITLFFDSHCRKTMQTTFKVIVERHLDHWSAWFDGFPDLARDGDCHDDAVLQLLELFGEELFDLEQVVVIGESASDERLEMIVPLRSLRRVAPPSIN